MTPALLDRAVGAVLGAAAGDALGAGYEYGSAPLPPRGQAAMIGGGLGNFAPGEWTDDTAQAVPIVSAAARGLPLDGDAAADLSARLARLADVPAGIARGLTTAFAD